MSNKIVHFTIGKENTFFVGGKGGGDFDAGHKPLMELSCVNKHLV